MTETSLVKNARDRVGTAGTGRRALAGACVAVIIVSHCYTKSSLFFQDLGENLHGRRESAYLSRLPCSFFPTKRTQRGW